MPNGTQAPATAEGPIQHTQKTAGALAIRPDQTQWTEQQAAVLRQSGIKDEVTAAELSGFLHLCQRTGLDPFSRQIYLIGRKDKRAGREVYTPQTGIDGYRVIAQRVTAQTGGTYGYEDTVWCDASGKWRDVWLADAPPAAAKVTVIRNGQRFSAVATFREYVQTFPDGNPKGLWAKMPAGQIAKCAETLALRKAFPHDLAGVYTAEEMDQADNPAPAQPQGGVVHGGNTFIAPEPFVPHPEGQAIADKAKDAKDRAEVKKWWAEAAAAEVINSGVNAPDTGKPDVLGDYLKRVGSALPEEASSEDDDVQDAEIVNETSSEEGNAPADAEPLEALTAKVSNSWNNALGMKQNLIEGKKLGVLDVMVPDGKSGSVKLGDLMQSRIDQLEADSQERNAA